MAFQPFVWGQGGEMLSPEQAKRQREIAAALFDQNGTTAKTFGDGIAQVARAITGSTFNGQADASEEAGRAELAQLLAGIGPNSDMSSLLSVYGNGWANDQEKAIAELLINQDMQQQSQAAAWAREDALSAQDWERNAPMRDAQLEAMLMGNEAAALELEQARAPKAPMPYDPNAPTSWQEFQLGQANPEYAATLADEPLVTNIIQPNAGDDSFFSGLNAAEGKTYAAFLEQAPVAARNLSQLDQLEGLLATTPQGMGAAATSIAGQFGIDLGNATGVQAAQALINQLVPAQRQPGSGPMSDADLALFKQSVPQMINQPGGNALIMKTMRDINQYDLALAQITQEGLTAADMATTPQERAAIRSDMRAKISALQNPMDGFEERMKQFEGSTTPQQPALEQSQAPVVNTQAEYDALPSGSPYKAPDGTIRTKR